MKKILLGFDGSEGSENALNKAMMIMDENGELISLWKLTQPSDTLVILIIGGGALLVIVPVLFIRVKRV